MQCFFKALTHRAFCPPPCQLPTTVTMQSSYFLHSCPRAAGLMVCVYLCSASAELWKHPPSPHPHSLLHSLTDIEVTALCLRLPQLPVLSPPQPVGGLSLCWGTAPGSSSRSRRSPPLHQEGVGSFAFFPGHLLGSQSDSCWAPVFHFQLAFYFLVSLNSLRLKKQTALNEKL